MEITITILEFVKFLKIFKKPLERQKSAYFFFIYYVDVGPKHQKVKVFSTFV